MGQKSVLDVIYIGFFTIKNDGNNVETSVCIDAMAENISIGSIYQARLLLLGHGKIGFAVSIACACFHLHNDQILPVFGYNVNLLVSIAPITFKDFVAFLDQIIGRNLLTQSAQFVMFCHNCFI